MVSPRPLAPRRWNALFPIVRRARTADHDPPLCVAKMVGYAFGSNPPYDLRARAWRKDGASAATAALAHSFARRAIPAYTPCANCPSCQSAAGMALVASGKSERSSRASRLDEEGRYGQSSRHVRRGCDGRGWHVRRTWLSRTAKSRGPGLPTLRSSLAMMLRITPATGARKPGPRGDRDISRNPPRRECRLIRLNLW